MKNKYEVICKEQILGKVYLYSLLDLENHDDYSCLIDRYNDKEKADILMDDMANKFDVSEALFKYDFNLFPILPIDMITFNMEQTYNEYNPGMGVSFYKNEEEFERDYKIEEERVKELRDSNKKLVRSKI